MADVITGNTQLTATKEAVIAAIVQKELKFASKMLPLVTDVSVFAGKGAKSVSFPKLASFTVTNRASGVAGDASTLLSSVDTIALDQNAYVAWIIDSMDETQTKIEAQLEFAKRAASAHGRYVDSYIVGQLLAAAGLDAGAVPITRDLILDMHAFLLGNDADPNALALVIGVDQQKEMLKIAEFTQAQIFGNAVIPNGQIGSVYGVPVIVSNEPTLVGKALMFEKSGYAIAFQKAPAMSEQLANQYGTSAKRVAMDQLFGGSAMQLGEKGLLATQSPLIAKI